MIQSDNLSDECVIGGVINKHDWDRICPAPSAGTFDQNQYLYLYYRTAPSSWFRRVMMISLGERSRHIFGWVRIGYPFSMSASAWTFLIGIVALCFFPKLFSPWLQLPRFFHSFWNLGNINTIIYRYYWYYLDTQVKAKAGTRIRRLYLSLLGRQRTYRSSKQLLQKFFSSDLLLKKHQPAKFLLFNVLFCHLTEIRRSCWFLSSLLLNPLQQLVIWNRIKITNGVTIMIF